MSTDYTVHLGPYVICQNSLVDSVSTRRACTNRKCRLHTHDYFDKSHKFCTLCGTKIDEVKFNLRDKKVSGHELQEEMDEKLIVLGIDCSTLDKNDDIWVSNIRRPKNKRKLSFDPKFDGEQYIEITPELMAEEISEFVDQFRDEISILRKAYGLENVTIKWGLIHSIH